MPSSSSCRSSGGSYTLPTCVNCPACDRSQAVLDSPDLAWWDTPDLWETVGWLVKFAGVGAFLVAATIGCTTLG
jgi:hypothetical protein